MPAGKGRFIVGAKGTHGCDGYPVVGGEGKVHGCHPTRAAAIQQQRALYAAEAQSKKSHDGAITNEDAKGIAAALQEAWNEGMNVVVHCHMGVSRSGAVAEVGTIMGFRDVGKFRVPNLMVKKKLMEQLGMI